MKLPRMGKHAPVSLIFLGILIAVLASAGTVNATQVTLIKEHHPPSTLKDPTDAYDAYLAGQSVNFHINLNVTTSTPPFSWLSISNLTIIDSLPNTIGGGPLYMTYVSGSQNSTSAPGAGVFTDFHNGTLQWNFGQGPFTTGVLAPEPFSVPGEFYQASITFNATVNSNILKDTYLTNTGVATYNETESKVHSSPSTSDTIWVAGQPPPPPPPPPPTGGYLQPVDKLTFLFATIEDILVSNYWIELPAVGAIAALIIFKRRRRN